MNNQTKRITEGAMMVALVGVMLFVNRQFANMIEFFMYWILTFPILIYTARYGLRYGIITSVCMLLLSFMISSPTTIFYLFCCVVSGVVYGEGVRRKWKNGMLLVLNGVFTLLFYIITTVVFAAFFGYDPAEDVEMVRMLMEFLNVNTAAVHMNQIIPAIVIITAVVMSVLQTICIHMLAHILLQRLKIECLPMKSLFDLCVPRYWGMIIIIIWILFLSRNVLKLNQEVSTALLAIFLCAFIFAIGYGVLTCMMWLVIKRKRGGIFIVMLAVLLPYAQDVIAIIGISDMLFAMREQMKRGVIHG